MPPSKRLHFFGLLRKVDDLLTYHQPAVLVVEDVAAKGCRRRKRAREEINRMEQFGIARGVRVERASRLAVLRTFLPAKNKYEVALRLAEIFPGFKTAPSEETQSLDVGGPAREHLGRSWICGGGDSQERFYV